MWFRRTEARTTRAAAAAVEALEARYHLTTVTITNPPPALFEFMIAPADADVVVVDFAGKAPERSWVAVSVKNRADKPLRIEAVNYPADGPGVLFSVYTNVQSTPVRVTGWADTSKVHLSLIGNDGPDYFTLESPGETIGWGGNDTLIGSSGDDRISGEDGDDLILASSGNDIIRGGYGNDLIIAGDGDDKVYGNGGPQNSAHSAAFYVKDPTRGPIPADDDLILGGDGNDSLFGDEGADIILGGAGSDLLVGDNDILGLDSSRRFGPPSQPNYPVWGDTLDGGAGKDVLYTGFGNDVVLGVPPRPVARPVLGHRPVYRPPAKGQDTVIDGVFWIPPTELDSSKWGYF